VLDMAGTSLNDFGDQEQAPLNGGCATLVGVALVRLRHHIVTQAQLNVLNHGNRVRQGLDAGRVDGAHLFNDVKKTIELAQHAGALIGRQGQLRQAGNPVNISGGQGHKSG
jgi:hypothetical protein